MKEKIFKPPIFSLRDVLRFTDSKIYEVFFSTGLMVIKNNEQVSIKNLNNLLQKFGSIFSNPSTEASKFFYNKNPSVIEISENKMFGGSSMNWHKDMSYINNDYYGTLLCNRSHSNTIPTEFIYTKKSSYAETYKEFEYGAYSKDTDLSKKYTLRKRFCKFNASSLFMESVKKDFLMKHPITRESTIYFSPATALSSKSIVKQIEQDLLSLNKAYEHHWSENDIILFDNLQLMHRRKSINKERKLIRMQFNYKNVCLN